jgi:hypothetical protein
MLRKLPWVAAPVSPAFGKSSARKNSERLFGTIASSPRPPAKALLFLYLFRNLEHTPGGTVNQ